jgi:hypothetical protein
MTHAGVRCPICEQQRDLLSLFGEEGDLASLAAIDAWHDGLHVGGGPFTPEDPAEGWAGRTTQADSHLALADLVVRADEVTCGTCFLVHRPGCCDR